jgi:D-ribose pyranose/furanose isomerase RbsD
MKRGGILNAALAHAIASAGHGDLLMIVDAGFPIPVGANRIDLAVTQDIPDLRTVLALVRNDFIAEGVTIAAEMATNNPELESWLRGAFADSTFELVPHEEMLSSVPLRARAIVRTGAFDPWGNIALRSGVDVPRWFTKDGVKVPDYYRDRIAPGKESQSP